MFLKNLENFRKICIQSVFRAKNHDSFANFTNFCCKAWIVLIFSRIWGSVMFLACSYFFRNLSIDVLISMVLIKKKGVLQRERCIFSPFIKENSLVSTDNPSYIPTATKISSSVIELPYNCLFTNCLLINGTGAKQKETNKSLNWISLHLAS